MRNVFVILAAGLVALTGAGCAAGGGGWKPLVYQTNSVPTVVELPGFTNLVDVPAVVNEAGEVIQAAGQVQVVTPGKVVTNWVKTVTVEVNPIWRNGIAGAEKINANFNPTPSAPLVTWLLGAANVGLAWFSRFQTRRLNEKAQEESKAQALLKTVIQGVEAANVQEVKDQIAKLSRLTGNRAELQAQVERLTK